MILKERTIIGSKGKGKNFNILRNYLVFKDILEECSQNICVYSFVLQGSAREKTYKLLAISGFTLLIREIKQL